MSSRGTDSASTALTEGYAVISFVSRGRFALGSRAMAHPYTCPCCGHLVFDEPPGSDDICLICFWEDDVTQLRWPRLGGGANVASLIEAQKSYAAIGASEERFRGDVRQPRPDEARDPEWRPISDADPFEAPDESAPWPQDRTQLYYWRPTYWRARPI